MGKGDDKKTKDGAHKATDSESKHKNQPSFNYFGNAPLAKKSSFFATIWEQAQEQEREHQWTCSLSHDY